MLEYETEEGMVCASYETLSSNGCGGHAEIFMGDRGTLELSESASRLGVYRDPRAPDWDKWVCLGFLHRPGIEQTEQRNPDIITAEETKLPLKYEIPVTLQAPYPQPHLRTFFDAVRGRAQLNCPAEIALAATVTALKINEALEKGQTLTLTADAFVV